MNRPHHWSSGGGRGSFGLLGLSLAISLLPGCRPQDSARPAAAASPDSASVPTVAEAWMTPRDTADNIDSPAVWHGHGGQHWLMATAKWTNVLVVSDASTGRPVRRVGGTGSGRGQLKRPNGVAVMDDLAFVVERDNRRVQVFRLPEFRSLGTFGEKDLKVPYGIGMYSDGEQGYLVYVTDNYEMPADSVPPDSLLGERVRRYRVTVRGDRLRAESLGAFGETSGPGVLKVVESVAVDVPNHRLLIVEEWEGGSHITVYTLDGRFTGTIVGAGLFPHQAEGVTLYGCEDRTGYWIAVDQDETVNTFHVFDRSTLEHIGSFRGDSTRNSDGIALTQEGFGGFPNGAFYAVHNDGNVAAFSWDVIADALKLRKDCGAPGGKSGS